MVTKTERGLRAMPGALLRLAVGAAIGCALGGFIALAGYGLAREAYGSRDPSALRMSLLGGAVALAFPGALAIIRMYSARERWTSGALTFTLFPGAAIGALGGVAALTLGWASSWVLQLAGAAGPTQAWSQIVLGATMLGAVLGAVDLRRKSRR